MVTMILPDTPKNASNLPKLYGEENLLFLSRLAIRLNPDV